MAYIVYLYARMKFYGKKQYKNATISNKGLGESAHVANRNICHSTSE